MRLNDKTYKLIVNTLQAEIDNSEDIRSEATVLDKATEFLIANPQVKRYIEYELGSADAVRRLAEDIGYIRGERFSYSDEDKLEITILPCAFCKYYKGGKDGCLKLGTVPDSVWDFKTECSNKAER